MKPKFKKRYVLISGVPFKDSSGRCRIYGENSEMSSIKVCILPPVFQGDIKAIPEYRVVLERVEGFI